MRGSLGLLALAVLMASPALMTGCDAEPAPVGLQVRLFTPAGAADPFQGVAFIRVKMEADDLGNNQFSQIYPYTPTGSVELAGVPFGEGRQVIVEGWSATESGSPLAVVSRGKSMPTRVLSGAAAQQLDILFARVNSFATMTAVDTGAPQSMVQGRIGHTMTRTPRGEVLIAGGGVVSTTSGSWWEPDGMDQLLDSVEIVDEGDMQAWLYEAPGESPDGMFFTRVWHTATSLNTGQVLFAGGYYTTTAKTGDSCTGECASPGATCVEGQCRVQVNVPGKRVEVYYPEDRDDPADIRLLVPEVDMDVARAGHTATLVDEKEYVLLFVGGDDEGTYELWSPVVGTIKREPLPDGFPRRFHQATLFTVPGLDKPAVLITGGENDEGLVDTALVYDIGSDLMFVHSGGLSEPRVHHTSTYVPGRNYVYLTGGFKKADRSKASTAIDVYDISNDTFLGPSQVKGFKLNTARGAHAAVPLPGNSVLISGGIGHDGAVLGSIEIIYEYMDVEQNQFVISVAKSGQQGVPDLPSGLRFGQQGLFLDNGMALLTGGALVNGDAVQMPTDLLLYNPQ